MLPTCISTEIDSKSVIRDKVQLAKGEKPIFDSEPQPEFTSVDIHKCQVYNQDVNFPR